MKDILKSEHYFPSFRDLGDEHGFDERYWKIHRGVGTQAYTWCFLGEITNDETSQSSFLRNRILVRDRQGNNNIVIAFYPESGQFDFKTLKRGHTVCVMLAERHYFLDRTVGLRIEDLDTIKVIPSALDDLFAISTFYSQCQRAC